MNLTQMPSIASIAQSDLEELISLRNRMESVQRMLATHEENLLMRLVHGSFIQPGIHQAWIEESVSGRCRRQRLMIR